MKRVRKKKKIKALHNSPDGVVVMAECCQAKWLRLIPAWDVRSFKFFLERKEKDHLKEQCKSFQQ